MVSTSPSASLRMQLWLGGGISPNRDLALIGRLAGSEVELDDLTIRSATPGRDAVGEVSLRIRVADRSFSGQGASTDVVNAAVRAYLHALSKSTRAVELEARALAAAGDLWGV
jgi:hypothetical protein